MVNVTSIVPNPGGKKQQPGQHFHFRLEASGPIAQFTFASSIDGLLESSHAGQPQSVYEWDRDSKQTEELDLTMVFLACKTYDYTVQLRNDKDEAIETVLQKMFEGETDDTASESFTAVVPPKDVHATT